MIRVVNEQQPSIAAVVGSNCRRIRTTIGITQSELAIYAREFGLRWTASKVGDFESGRSSPLLATVLALVLALQKATEERLRTLRGEQPGIDGVRLPDLIGIDGLVALNDELLVAGRELADICAGDVPVVDDRRRIIRRRAPGKRAPSQGASEVLQRFGLAEHRLSKQLGVDQEELARVSFQLWRSTFSEERDRRAGPDASQQKKGRITRELRVELEKAIADGND